MKKIILVVVGFMFVASSFAQFGASKVGMACEDLEQIKELKSTTLYIYIEKPKELALIIFSNNKTKEEATITRDFYQEVIKENWSFCVFKILNKDEYKKLSKKKDLFFLTNTLVGVTLAGKPGAKKGGRYLMLSLGKPKFNNIMKNTAIFTIPAYSISSKKLNGKLKELDMVKVLKEKIKTDILLLNNYLNDCISYNTASMKEIGIKNAPSLKGKKIMFHNRMVKFEQEELNEIKNFSPNVISNAEVKDAINEIPSDKDAYSFIPLFPPIGIITNNEHKICYYFKPQKPSRYKLTLEDLKEFDKSVGE